MGATVGWSPQTHTQAPHRHGAAHIEQEHPMADAHIPDKPALEGLEAKWGAAWETAGHLPCSIRDARAANGERRVYSIDTPPPTASGIAAHRPRLQLHAHRPRRALPAHARQERLLPDGLGRQRPAHRAPRAELLRRALRPDRCPTTPDFTPPLEGGDNESRKAADQVPDLPPQLHRAVRDAHRRGREAVRGRSGASSA